MNKLLSVLTLLLLSHTASATGAYTCTINDGNMAFEMTGVLSHGMPTGPVQERGTLQFKRSGMGAYDLSNIEKSTQFWQADEELNLLVYYEPATPQPSSAQLIIKTKVNSSGGFVGSYRYTVRDWQSDQLKQNLSGIVKCEVE